MAWEIAPGAGRPNSGPVIDTWHVQNRSTEFQRDLELFESIPADRLANLHVADALLAPQAHSLYAERRFSRFPGDGELAIEQVVRLLDSKGGLKRIDTEMVGRALDGLTTAAARRAGCHRRGNAVNQAHRTRWTLEPQGPQAITGQAVGRPVALTLWSWH
jgi:sugar phosphate isomerase/epimerase